MRARIGALAFVVILVAAACGGGGSGGGAASAAPAGGGGGGGGAAATQVAVAICASLKPLETAVATIDALKPTDSPITLNMGANGLATQLATFVSLAPGDLRQAAQPLKTAIQGLRDALASAKSDPGALTTAIQAVDAAWKDLQAKIQAVCPS